AGAPDPDPRCSRGGPPRSRGRGGALEGARAVPDAAEERPRGVRPTRPRSRRGARAPRRGSGSARLQLLRALLVLRRDEAGIVPGDEVNPFARPMPGRLRRREGGDAISKEDIPNAALEPEPRSRRLRRPGAAPT